MKNAILLRRIHIIGMATIFGALFVQTCRLQSANADIEKFEKRSAYSIPADVISNHDYPNLPRCLETFLKDRIPFREQLITWRNSLLYELWKAPGYDSVVIGKNDWLFNNYTDLLNPNDVGGGKSRPFTDEQLQKHAEYFLAVNEFLTYRKIPYALVIVPTKQTVYPEFLPDHSNQFVEWTRADQLITYLKNNSTITIIDLREEVNKRKKEGPVFLRLDTHWNCYAALKAYDVMIAKLQQVLPRIKPFKSVYEAKDTVHHPDLGLMSRIPKYLSEPTVDLKRKNAPHPCFVTMYKGSVISITDDRTAPRALVYHDSMFMNLLAYFADHFSYGSYHKQKNFEVAHLQECSPDLVVQEMSEGVLSCNFLKNELGPELEKERLEHAKTLVRFEPSNTFSLTDCHWSDDHQLVSTSKDPRIEFFCPTDLESHQRKVKLTIKSNRESLVQVFFAKNNEEFTPAQSESMKVKNGENYFAVSIPDDVTRIRLDPCDYAGTVGLNFDVRACNNDKLAFISTKEKRPESHSSLFGEEAELLTSFSSNISNSKDLLKNCQVESKSGSLICTNEDPQIYFSAGDMHNDRVLRFVAEVNEPTYVQIFYKNGFEDFTESQSIHARLCKGKNELFLSLPRNATQFRLDPCASKGTCKISFQVATVPNSDVHIAQKDPTLSKENKTY